VTRPVPYPADTRAKGWRFELDHERIEQSDTWTLAPAEVRPWLLMLWLTAWRQEPCGSLSNSDELIAARIGMPMKAFSKHRAVLMRGWWLADDGRLYHDTVTKRVIEMIAARDKDRTRKAAYRARMDAERSAASHVNPDLSHGTDDGRPKDSGLSDPGRDDTGTRTGTSTSKEETPPAIRSTSGSVGVDGQSPTKAGEVCRAIRAKGIADANPSNPELLAFIAKGVTVETFEAAAAVCVDAKPPKGMAYLLGIVRRQLNEAAAIAAGPGVQVGLWDATRSSIVAKAAEFGMGPWDEYKFQIGQGESFAAYTARVRARVEGVPA
jgi:hypothetical protein